MCYSDIDTLKEIVLNSKYSFLFDTKKDVELFMERRIERYLYFKFKKAIQERAYEHIDYHCLFPPVGI